MKQFWKQNAWVRWTVWLLIALGIGFLIASFLLEETIVEKETVVEKRVVEEKIEERIFEISASDAYVVGRYGNGVDWDGKDVRSVRGRGRVQVDPFNAIGQVSVKIGDASMNPEDQTHLNGEVEIVFKQFTLEGGRAILMETTLFGSTGKYANLYPATEALVAGFGTAEVRLDGEVVYNDLEALFFYGPGLRREDGSIKNEEGEPFRPKTALGEFVDPSDRELHVIVHSPDADTKNYPPYEAWINIFFEETQVSAHPPGTKI